MESKQVSEAYDAGNAKLIILKQAISIGMHQAENNIFSEKSILDLIDSKQVSVNCHREEQKALLHGSKKASYVI